VKFGQRNRKGKGKFAVIIKTLVAKEKIAQCRGGGETSKNHCSRREHEENLQKMQLFPRAQNYLIKTWPGGVGGRSKKGGKSMEHPKTS